MSERVLTIGRMDTHGSPGVLVQLVITKVLNPVDVRYKNRAESIRIVDQGYVWEQFFPDDQRYTITRMYDRDRILVQTYIDICNRHGMTENGMSWYDDLYVDIVVFPDGAMEVLDMEELYEAYNRREIDNDQFELAFSETCNVLKRLSEGEFN